MSTAFMNQSPLYGPFGLLVAIWIFGTKRVKMGPNSVLIKLTLYQLAVPKAGKSFPFSHIHIVICLPLVLQQE